MKTLKWYFNHGKTYQIYSVIYEDEKYIIVKDNDSNYEENCEYGAYSFGLKNDFGTLYGFPVSQSCIKKEKVIEILKDWINIDKKYIPTLGYISINKINRWQSMIKILQQKN